MFTGLIVMAILGCSDDGEDCRQVGSAPQTYVSLAECNAASSVVLARYSDQPYPVLTAACATAPRVQVAERRQAR